MLHDSGFVRIAPKAGAFVRACFAQPQGIIAEFDVELSSVNVAGADSLKAGGLRTLLLAERKSDNEDVALFDTDDACTKGVGNLWEVGLAEQAASGNKTGCLSAPCFQH